MHGKIALVTGSTRGIGLEIGKRLAEAGATVILNSRKPKVLEEIVGAAKGEGLSIDGVVFDASIEPQVEEGIRRIIDRHGQLDILVNNAGILHPKDVFETELLEWDAVLRNNLTSSFLCSRAAMRHFRERGSGGRIIMIGSVAGQRGAPAGAVAYSASKAGMIGLAQTLAYTGAELGVTVNVVSPGMVETEMLRQGFGDSLDETARRIPLGIGRPSDIAEAVLFLAGETGRYITGASLDVNGGLYHR